MKLAVTDLDGTLLTSDSTVFQQNIETFFKLKQHGILPVVATGRIGESALPYARQIGADKLMMFGNGSVIWNLEQNKIVSSAPIHDEDTLSVLSIIKKHQLYFRAYIGNECYGEAYHPNDVQHLTTDIILPDLTRFITENHLSVLKIFIMFEDQSSRSRVREELEKLPGLELTSSWSDNIEVNRVGVNKGFGLKMLCQYLNIDLKEVIAFGDSENDLEMLRQAGIGVAMGNAVETVKQAADFVTLDHDSGGISYAVQKLLGIY